MTMCKVYGSFIKNTGSTGSLNYRLYIDNVSVGTFATKSGGIYNVNMNSTCVPRFGDNKCVNLQSRFTHNVQHTIKLQVQLDDGNWYYAQAHSPFPKTLTCKDPVVTTPTPVPTKTKTSTPVPPTPTTVPPTKTATPVITATATKTPTPAVSQTPVPYQIQNSVVHTTNFAYPDLGCKWMGIAGQVFDKSGNPIPNSGRGGGRHFGRKSD